MANCSYAAALGPPPAGARATSGPEWTRQWPMMMMAVVITIIIIELARVLATGPFNYIESSVCTLFYSLLLCCVGWH